MIRLFHGRGQLGTAFRDILRLNPEIYNPLEADIYHTWNFLDKSEETQAQCLNKFRQYLDNLGDRRTFFISTKSRDNNPYVNAKREAESYLLNGTFNASYIRIPNLIGKGICERFIDENTKPYGEIELILVEDAAEKILKYIKTELEGREFPMNTELRGTKIDARIVKELVQVGVGARIL